MYIRLETISEPLVTRLREATPATQRAAAVEAARLALRLAGVAIPSVDSALDEITSRGEISAKVRVALEEIVSGFEQRAFQVQEQSLAGNGVYRDYLPLFSAARAVSAILMALQENPFEAACEAIYEAAATTDDSRIIVEKISQFLSPETQ